MKVHKGSAKSVKAINAALDDCLKDRAFKGLVLTTGHSKGGAESQLTTLQTALHLENLEHITGVDCITFGSPHVGNKAFYDAYNDHVQVRLRIVNGCDPVTHLPPLSLFPSSAKVGNVIHVGPKKAQGPFKFNPFCMTDHDITWYRHHMEEKDEEHVEMSERVGR